MALFEERGYEQTTVAEIAARAGLTERTFFRHFADKREVFFAHSDIFERNIVDAVAAAPDDLAPMATVVFGMHAGARPLDETPEGHAYAARRQQILGANAELIERELIKLAQVRNAVGDLLRRRGVLEPVASLTAEVGMSIFSVAFVRWIEGPATTKLSDTVDQTAAALPELVLV
jgi:AcrR family transcriptional regulator